MLCARLQIVPEPIRFGWKRIGSNIPFAAISKPADVPSASKSL